MPEDQCFAIPTLEEGTNVDSNEEESLQQKY